MLLLGACFSLVAEIGWLASRAHFSFCEILVLRFSLVAEIGWLARIVERAVYVDFRPVSVSLPRLGGWRAFSQDDYAKSKGVSVSLPRLGGWRVKDVLTI